MTRSARLALTLAVLAVLAVLGSAAVTVTAYTARDPGGPAGPGRASPGATPGATGHLGEGQTVRGAHGRASFEAPSAQHGWTRQGRDTVLYYLDRHGAPSVGVRGAAVYRAGYCRGREDSNRAFAGFAAPVVGDSVRAVNTDLARRWVRAIALAGDLTTRGRHTPLRTDDVTLADGTRAVRTRSRITVARPGPCVAPAVDLAMLSIDTGESVATLVLVRDTGARGTLPDGVADAILASLRPVAD